MCLIIDACVTHRVINLADRDYEPVRASLLTSKQILVVGGQLRLEYIQYPPFRRFLAELDRKGRVRTVSDVDIDAATAEVEASGECESNDAHLIALARVTGARVLCSEDTKATRDFKRKSLLDRPRGKVYQNRKHRHLLTDSCAKCL